MSHAQPQRPKRREERTQRAREIAARGERVGKRGGDVGDGGSRFCFSGEAVQKSAGWLRRHSISMSYGCGRRLRLAHSLARESRLGDSTVASAARTRFGDAWVWLDDRRGTKVAKRKAVEPARARTRPGAAGKALATE